MTFASGDWKDVGGGVCAIYYVSINIPTRPSFFPVNAAPARRVFFRLHAIDTDYISYEDERKLIQKDVGNSHSSPNILKRKRKYIYKK